LTHVTRDVVPWYAVAAGYLVFSIYATWPALPDLWGGFPLADDPSVSAWGLWWVKEAIVHLDNPWYTRLMAAPEGVYLSFHALTPLAGIVLSPLTALIGPADTLGVAKLVLPPVSALFAQRASRRLGLDFVPSVIAGALYGFATVIVWKTTFHFNFGFGAPFLPLGLLAAARVADRRGVWDWVWLGVVLGASALVDGFIAFLAVVAAGSYLLAVDALPRRLAGLRGLGAGVLAAVVVAAPQLYMTQKAQAEGQYDVVREGLPIAWTTYNASVDTLLSPGNIRPLVPGELELWSTRHDLSGGSSAYGWGLLGLAIAGVLLTRTRPRPLWWAAALALVASMLALGPEIEWSTGSWIPLEFERYDQRLSGLMPYSWLVQLPVFEDFRVSARFAQLGVLGLAVLAGFGVQALWSRRWGRVAATCLLALAALEAGWPDGGRTRTPVPEERTALYAPVRADRSSSTLIDVPYGLLGGAAAAFGSQMPGNEFMLRATEHGHPILGAWVTRLSRKRVEAATRHRLLVDLAVLQGRAVPPGAPLNVAPADAPVDPAKGRTDADALRLRWAVVWPWTNPEVMPYLRQIGFRRVGSEDGITLMRR
jgi:hypothetical protein